MAKLVFLPAAEADIERIEDFIAADDPAAAVAFTDRIEQKCLAVAEYPHMGMPRPELGADLRYFPVGRYLVFYRPTEDQIEIVRVLHGAREVLVQFDADN